MLSGLLRVAQQSGAAAAVQRVGADEIELRQRLVDQRAELHVGRLEVLPASSRCRCGSGARPGPPPSRSIACGAAVGRSVGTIVARHSSSSVPLTMRRLSASSSLRSVACALTSVCRRVASSAWACTTSIGAIVPISTRERLSADQLRRQVQRRLRRIHRLARVDQFPIGVADLRHRARRRRLEGDLGDVLRDPVRLHQRAVLVDFEVLQQWLDVLRPEARLIAGIDGRIRRIAGGTLVGEVHRIVAAALPHVLRESTRPVLRVLRDAVAAGEEVRVQLHRALVAERRRQVRLVVGEVRRDRQIPCFRRDALARQRQVLVEGAGHGLL